MNSTTIKWSRSLKVKGIFGLVLVSLTFAISIVFVMNSKGKSLVLAESSEKIEQIGHNIISDLTIRSLEIAALARTMASLVEKLPKSVDSYNSIFPELIDFQKDMDIAGGGIWPEPYAFDVNTEKRSFFWGRDEENKLAYFDDYNQAGSGYHHEEWYVTARHVDNNRCSWSRSYTDPFSFQPMVTCTVATYSEIFRDQKIQREFTGAVTIDLKLAGLQAFTDNWQKATGGYVFITDQNNKFITFPDPESAKNIGIDEQGKRIEEFMVTYEYAQKDHLFTPIADTMMEMSQNLLEIGQRMPIYSPAIAEQIYKDALLPGNISNIDKDEALLRSAIVTNPFVGGKLYKKTLLEKAPLLKEKSLAYFFFVPHSYWKVVIVVPHDEATRVATNIVLWLLFYIFIAFVPITIIATFVLDWRLIEVLAGTTGKTKKMISLVQNKKLNKLAEQKITHPVDDEIGHLTQTFSTLLNEVLLYYKNLLMTQYTSNAEIESRYQLKTDINATQMAIENGDKILLHQAGQSNGQTIATTNYSTIPIVEIWDKVLAFPQIGDLHQSNIVDRVEAIVTRAHEKEVEFVIIDSTGITFSDSAVLMDFYDQLLQAFKLVGIQFFLIGILPDVAREMLKNKDVAKKLTTFNSVKNALIFIVSEIKARSKKRGKTG